MAWDRLKLGVLFLKFLVPYFFKSLVQRVSALIHKSRYKPLESAQNIVIIGGSFAGVQVSKTLADSVPTGYKVVLIEKNSHFNYSFNFPRYSVLQGHERRAFIPYDGITSGAPAGAFELIHDEAVRLTENSVTLVSGREVSYAYLAIATGSWQPSPSKLKSTECGEACLELRQLQLSIESAENIAIVGGGAVGVELASDIKSYYPGKLVTLVHSRKQLLPRFGKRLHDHVMDTLEKLGIRIILGQRPQLSYYAGDEKGRSLSFAEGRVETFDLVIPCTGLKPNTGIINNLNPDLISKETGEILVQPTLQVACQDNRLRNIFALGDVADTGGPKMARAAFFQAEIVKHNIMSMMRRQPPSAKYEPKPEIDGALKLTLGKDQTVLYTQLSQGSDILLPGKGGSEDLDAERAWKMYGASLKDLSD